MLATATSTTKRRKPSKRKLWSSNLRKRPSPRKLRERPSLRCRQLKRKLLRRPVKPRSRRLSKKKPNSLMRPTKSLTSLT